MFGVSVIRKGFQQAQWKEQKQKGAGGQKSRGVGPLLIAGIKRNWAFTVSKGSYQQLKTLMDESAEIWVKKGIRGGGTLRICRVPRGGIAGFLNALYTTELSPSSHRPGDLNPEMFLLAVLSPSQVYRVHLRDNEHHRPLPSG